MEVLHDREDIARRLSGHPLRHLYLIGDLDDRYWPGTVWYGGHGQVVLLYTALNLPVVHAVAHPPEESMRALVAECAHLLPRRFYSHLSPPAVDVLSRSYGVEDHGMYHQMALRDLHDPGGADVEPLTSHDVAELHELYQAAYPEHWFEPRMLDGTRYYGVRVDGRLVSVAGVHVYSPMYRVAALGNIATHPDFRGRGFARAATAGLCRDLAVTVEHIGLNVAVDNPPALRCYSALGFEVVGDYQECMLTAR